MVISRRDSSAAAAVQRVLQLHVLMPVCSVDVIASLSSCTAYHCHHGLPAVLVLYICRLSRSLRCTALVLNMLQSHPTACVRVPTTSAAGWSLPLCPPRICPLTHLLWVHSRQLKHHMNVPVSQSQSLSEVLAVCASLLLVPATCHCLKLQPVTNRVVNY